MNANCSLALVGVLPLRLWQCLYVNLELQQSFWESEAVNAVQERVSLRDCQVGPNFVVSEGSEHREEVLAKAPQRRSSEFK